MDHDQWVLSHHLRRSTCADDHGPRRAGEMLRGNHLHRLLGVPDSRPALVPQPVVVLPCFVQLLLLRRESGRLLWRGR